ncbi:MAG: DUF3179 domain-containing protein [Nitrosomonas sp.]|jgi:hypothetical protein|nr:DUF3179 domain-containing protein [Nitrosomonas sp.]
MKNICNVYVIVFFLFTGITQSHAATMNGFVLDGALIPENEIFSGGPPKDGIPSLDNPVFVNAAQAHFLRDSDRVLALTRNGISKAYPLRILNWHEIVNDRFGDESIIITYCPLCGSGTANKAEINGRQLQFGVSGLLYNNDVLMYDRQTQSLWSQILSQAVTGPMKGVELSAVPVTHTTWGDWRERHPNTLVLSQETGFNRNYHINPYDGYERDSSIMFPVRFRAEGYHPKEQVLGLIVDGKAKAYPFVELAQGSGVVDDQLGNHRIQIKYNHTHQSAEAFDEKGEPLPGVVLFWFAWYAFHPQTDIYRASH